LSASTMLALLLPRAALLVAPPLVAYRVRPRCVTRTSCILASQDEQAAAVAEAGSVLDREASEQAAAVAALAAVRSIDAPAGGDAPDAEAERTARAASWCVELNGQLARSTSVEGVLSLVAEHEPSLNAINVATALHRLAAINKKRRAGRDAMLRDVRFVRLIDALAEQSTELGARSVADVLWSLATLQHWPSTLLSPVLTAVNAALDGGGFEAQHLATMTWALAKLETKPVRLLEKIEAQVTPRLDSLSLQNVANLLWGFATLSYTPSGTLLQPLTLVSTLSPTLMEDAQPVEIANLAFALGRLAAPREHDEALMALARVASPECALPLFSSRQLVTLLDVYTRLDAAARLPDGLLDNWVAAVRTAHEARPLMARDGRVLAAALERLSMDTSWIKRSEMLNAWIQSVDGSTRRPSRSYSEEELRAAFDVIDADQSGDIDLDELRSAIRAIKTSTDDQAIEQMIALADADGSGSIDFEEFVDLMNLRRRAAV